MPTRQQTLRRAIDWSYELLNEDEQTLFRRLGVFVGGCTLDAIEAVLATEGRGLSDQSATAVLNPQSSALDGLAALVDKSLVQREDVSDGRSRFTMLETIREYARERLAEAGELERAQERHLASYLALAEAAEPLLSTSDQRVWLDRLEQDHDNLRAALAWAVDHDPEGALRLSGALADFWRTRGHLSEGRHWIERALAGADARARGGADPDRSTGASPDADAARAKALHSAGMLAHIQADGGQAEALFSASLAIARTLGDLGRVAIVLNDLAELAFLPGDAARAMTLCTEGLALARAADDRSAVARLLLGLGQVARAQGELDSAAAYYEESLAIGRALDDRRHIAWALLALGQLALVQGAHERTTEVFAEGLALARDVGDQESSAWLLYFTGRLLLEQHDLASAAARFAESAQLLHVLGVGMGVALNLLNLADVKIIRS
jgi:tetratricopeptide (TPR) repeat protein